MSRALDKVDGIRKIDIKKGDKDFTVHYDPARIQPAEMVAKLVAVGEKDARVKS